MNSIDQSRVRALASICNPSLPLSAPNSHSLTSGSSNQEELLRAYEYARRHPPPPIQYDNGHTRGQSHTSGTGTTESEATDPGIRQFSGTPPKPNERRQGACLTPGTQSENLCTSLQFLFRIIQSETKHVILSK